MTIAVLPGTYDPITLGHLDVAARAGAMFETVVVAVAHNSAKRPLLDVETRVALARDATAGMAGIEVASTDALLVDFCKEIGATAIVKGLRGGADYDLERPMALMNRSLTGIETVFLTGDSALAHIASSFVRDIAAHGGDISPYVTPAVREAVLEAVGRQA